MVLEEGLVPDSRRRGGLVQVHLLSYVSARLGLPPRSTKARSKLAAHGPGTWDRLVTGAWRVCTEESHTEE